MRLFTWIALIFKLIVVIVFWKDSLDFRNIIRQKKETPDDELNDILAQYDAWRKDNSDFKDTDLRKIYILRTLHNDEIKQSTFVLK